MVTGTYVLLVYSIATETVLYEKYGIVNKNIVFQEDNEKLWIFNCPSPKVMLIQVLNIATKEILHTKKHLLEENVQLIRQI